MQDPKKLTLLQKHASGTPSIVVAEIDFNNDISHVSRGGNRITIVFDPAEPSTYEVSGQADGMRHLYNPLGAALNGEMDER